MLTGAAVSAFDQVCHAYNDGILYHVQPSGVLGNLFRLLFYHLFQIVPVLIQFDRLCHTA